MWQITAQVRVDDLEMFSPHFPTTAFPRTTQCTLPHNLMVSPVFKPFNLL